MNQATSGKNDNRKSLFLFPYSRKSSAFTLIETLIYAALISIIIGMVIVITFQVVSGNVKLGEKIFLEEESSFLLRKLEWAIGGASAINSPASGTSSNSSLSINKFEVPPTENPIVFTVTNGDMTIKRGTADEVNLNSSLLSISNATFTHIAATGTAPAGIKIELSVVGASPEDTRLYEVTSYSRQ